MFRWHFLIHCFERNAHTRTHPHKASERERENVNYKQKDVFAHTVQVNNRICPLAMTEMNKRFHPHCLFS